MLHPPYRHPFQQPGHHALVEIALQITAVVQELQNVHRRARDHLSSARGAAVIIESRSGLSVTAPMCDLLRVWRCAGVPPRGAVIVAVGEICHRIIQRGILGGRGARGRGHGANASKRRCKASCIELDSRCIDVDGFCRWARCAGSIRTRGSGGISGALRARDRSRVREEGAARCVRAGRCHQPRWPFRCALRGRRRHDHAVEHDGSSLGRRGGRRFRIKQAGGRTR